MSDEDHHAAAADLVRRLGQKAKPHVEKVVAEHRELGDQGDAETWAGIARAVDAILSGHRR
jgi:hypothetical protein